MGHFVYQKSKFERLKDLLESIGSISLVGKVYLFFFLFLALSITVGTTLTSQRRSINNFAAERTVEAADRETPIDRVIKYIQTYFLPQPTITPQPQDILSE